MQVSWEWSRYDTIGGVVIMGILMGILVANILPQFTDTSQPLPWGFDSYLQTIRAQIELYNVQNPETRYDATTPVGPAFWEPLVRAYYLQTAPKNPLQNSSTVVGATPAMSTGWVWAPAADMVHADDGLPFYVLYAVDEHGNLYDGDQDGLPD